MHSLSDSPITFLVKVAAAFCAVLLVPLRLVQAVGGARPHLRILGKDAHVQNGGSGKGGRNLHQFQRQEHRFLQISSQEEALMCETDPRLAVSQPDSNILSP